MTRISRCHPIGVFARTVRSTMNDLSPALSILSVMLTPVILITACGSLLITTSTRLNRAVERVRKLSELLETERKEDDQADAYSGERVELLYTLLLRTSRRSRLLERAMNVLYLAISVFVATSVVIGAVTVGAPMVTWAPLIIGGLGIGLLFYTSILLIVESRIARASVEMELDFALRTAQEHFRIKPARKEEP